MQELLNSASLPFKFLKDIIRRLVGVTTTKELKKWLGRHKATFKVVCSVDKKGLPDLRRRSSWEAIASALLLSSNYFKAA